MTISHMSNWLLAHPDDNIDQPYQVVGEEKRSFHHTLDFTPTSSCFSHNRIDCNLTSIPDCSRSELLFQIRRHGQASPPPRRSSVPVSFAAC